MHHKVDGFSTIHTLNSHKTVLTYYIATYCSIQQGQLVDSGIQLGPVEVKYENGYTKAEVMATVVAAGSSQKGLREENEEVHVKTFRC